MYMCAYKYSLMCTEDLSHAYGFVQTNVKLKADGLLFWLGYLQRQTGILGIGCGVNVQCTDGVTPVRL